MSIKDGELPAYPFASDICGHHGGMTLRDYFAAKAMPALINDPERVDQSRAECARLAYAMADAMLAERNKE